VLSDRTGSPGQPGFQARATDTPPAREVASWARSPSSAPPSCRASWSPTCPSGFSHRL